MDYKGLVAEGNGGFRTREGQRSKASSITANQDECLQTTHDGICEKYSRKIDAREKTKRKLRAGGERPD